MPSARQRPWWQIWEVREVHQPANFQWQEWLWSLSAEGTKTAWFKEFFVVALFWWVPMVLSSLPPPKKNGEQCQWYFRKPRMTPTSNHPAQYFGMWFPNFISPFGIQRLHFSATIRGLLTFHRNTWLWRPKRLWCVWSWNASELQAFVSQLWSTSPAARRAYAKNLRSLIWHLRAVGSECNRLWV